MKTIEIKDIQEISKKMLVEFTAICKRHDIRYTLAYGSAIGAIRHRDMIPWDHDVDVMVPMEDMSKLKDVLNGELSDRFRLSEPLSDNCLSEFLFRISLKNTVSTYIHLDVFPLIPAPTDEIKQSKMLQSLKRYNDLFRWKHLKGRYPQGTLKKIASVLMYIALLPVSKKYLINKFLQICKQYENDKSNVVLSYSTCYGMKNFIKKDYVLNTQEVDFGNIKAPIPVKYDEYLRHYYGDYMKFPAESEQKEGLSFSSKISKNDIRILDSSSK